VAKGAALIPFTTGLQENKSAHRTNIIGYLQNVRLIGFFLFGQIVRFDLLQFSPFFASVAWH
jgi:hypothetical protein